MPHNRFHESFRPIYTAKTWRCCDSFATSVNGFGYVTNIQAYSLCLFVCVRVVIANDHHPTAWNTHTRTHFIMLAVKIAEYKTQGPVRSLFSSGYDIVPHLCNTLRTRAASIPKRLTTPESRLACSNDGADKTIACACRACT